jgi:adenylate cyclase
MVMNKKILIVDDEEGVLNTLKRLFRNLPYDIRFATSAADGLELLSESSADLVISDMRMPEMDGAEFLSIVKQRFPMSERILLTGYSDMESTVKAINQGGIFAYLSKPWDVDQLLALVKSALDQAHKSKLKNRTLKRFKAENDALGEDLQRKQREIAQSAELADHAFQKLKDSHKVTEQMLLNLLDLKQQGQREFASKMSGLAVQFASLLGLTEEQTLTLQIAASLHGIGKIGVPDAILDLPLDAMSESQLAAYKNYPANGASTLLAHEAFQHVAQVIFEQKEYVDGSGFPNGLVNEEISKLGRVLVLLLDYAELRLGARTGRSLGHEQALSAINKHKARYDQTLFSALESLTFEVEASREVSEMMLPLFSLREGMILNKDIYSESGILLLPKHSELTEGLIGHLMNIERNTDQRLLVNVRFGND